MPRIRSASLASSIVLVIAVLSVGSAASASDAAGGGRLWVARYDGNAHGSDAAAGSAISADGSVVYVAGTSWADAVRHDDLVTIAYGRGSGRRWVRSYDGKGSGIDTAVAVAPGPARVYVTGTSHGASTRDDYVTIAYTSAGERLWAWRYDGPTHGEDAASGLAVSPDGSTVFVTGSTATIAYRSDGTTLWTAPATPGEHLAVAPDGSKVYVTRVDGFDFLTVGIDAATGGGLWEARYEMGGGGRAIAGIAASPDGRRVYVAGAASDEQGPPWSDLIAYDDDGNQVWAKTVSQDYAGWATGLAIGADGTRIYVAGIVPFVMAYSPAGRELFQAYPWFQGMTDYSTLTAIAAAPAGSRVFVTGSTDEFPPGDFATFAIGAAGNQQWGVPYDGPGHGADWAASIVLSPDGSTVFVTGSSKGIGTGSDFATVAYSAG